MVTKGKMPNQIIDDDDKRYNHFCNMVDEMILMSDEDSELKDGLNYIENKARKYHISIYDMVYKILGEHQANLRIQAWKKEKGLI